MESAYLHVITDLIQSIGVAIAGLIIWVKPNWQIMDPICTFIFSILVLYSTIPLVMRVFHIFMEGTPSHVDWHKIEQDLSAIDGVVDVHDLHVWSLTSKQVAMTCHIRAYNPQEVLVRASGIARRENIRHITIQVQDAADASAPSCIGCVDASGSEMCVGPSGNTPKGSIRDLAGMV
jgi:zinc transporter 2